MGKDLGVTTKLEVAASTEFGPVQERNWQKTSRCAKNVLLKDRLWYVEHNYLLLCMVDCNRLHVSTVHVGHFQAFT